MSDPDAVDTAWRIHSAVMDWTAKVDNKASITLALESAIIVAAFAFTTDDRILASRQGWENYLYIAGLVVLGTAVILAGSVVMPQLRSRHTQSEAMTDFIFFGHARNWEHGELEDALRTTDILPMLARQIQRASALAWKKHQRLQWSLLTALPGALLVIWSAALAA